MEGVTIFASSYLIAEAPVRSEAKGLIKTKLKFKMYQKYNSIYINDITKESEEEEKELSD